MVEPGGGAGFPDEALLRTFVGCRFSGKELDGYLAIQPGVFRKIDLAHSARAQMGDNAVVRNDHANGQ